MRDANVSTTTPHTTRVYFIKLQTGATAAIRRIAVRETSVSQHHGETKSGVPWNSHDYHSAIVLRGFLIKPKDSSLSLVVLDHVRTNRYKGKTGKHSVRPISRRRMLIRFWWARGRGGKEARKEEKQVQTNRQGLETSNLTGGLGKEVLREEKVRSIIRPWLRSCGWSCEPISTYPSAPYITRLEAYYTATLLITRLNFLLKSTSD